MANPIRGQAVSTAPLAASSSGRAGFARASVLTRLLVLAASNPIGGQAVLEGVMMRGPSNWAVAVRKPDGDIAQVTKAIESPMKRHRLARLPVVRGVFALGESLAIGLRALAISANYAAQEEGGADEEVPTE